MFKKGITVSALKRIQIIILFKNHFKPGITTKTRNQWWFTESKDNMIILYLNNISFSIQLKRKMEI